MVFVLIALSIYSCKSDQDIPDVSHIKINPKFLAFEEKLQKIDTLEIANALQNLNASNPVFSELYLSAILRIKNRGADPKQVESAFKDFITYPLIRHLLDTVPVVHGKNRPKMEAEITEALKYYSYYFPDQKIPEFHTYLSGFEYGVINYGEDLVGIGLDFFMGRDYPHYPPGLFPDYVRRSMNPENIPKKVMETMVAHLSGQQQGQRLLDYMIFHGKQWYILQKLLPNKKLDAITEFTPEQTKWCLENEQEIWSFFVSEDLLYSNDYKKFRKYVSPSPTSPQMPAEAPGQTGVFQGMQIVSQFMKKNPEVTLSELLEMKDSQEILTQSKYKPRR